MVLTIRLFQDRLVANEFIQCRKVCEHVIEKVLGADITSNTGNASNSSQNSQSDGNSEGSQIPPEDRIELLCNDVVSETLETKIIQVFHLIILDSGPQHGLENSLSFYLETVR